MAITGELLEGDLRRLSNVADQVPGAVNNLLSATRDPNSTLTVGAGVDAVERAVDVWAAESGQVEQRLASHALEVPGDRFDVEARLAGIALLHVSLAEDVAVLAALDAVSADTLAAAVPDRAALPEQAVITVTVLGDGGLRDSLSAPAEGDSPEDPGADREAITSAVDDVVKDIVDRAGTAATTVVLRLSGLAVSAAHPLAEALNLAPGFIAEALRRKARKIGNLIRSLVGRAKKIFDTICGNYREILEPVQDDVMESVNDSLGAALIAKLLDAGKVRGDAAQRLNEAAAGGERDDRIKRMRKLKRLHERWVGPVRYTAEGLPLLIPVMVGPVSAAAIAAVGLLSWTVVITGDQLDSSRRLIPDFWPGVVRRAGGE
jgi:hypothetical protein